MPPPTPATLTNEIIEQLNIVAGERLCTDYKSSRGRAYEGYVFSLLYTSAMQAGLNPTLTSPGNKGSRPSEIHLRAGNGRLGSAKKDFAYIQATGNKSARSFEIHLSITYRGGSQAEHEIDLSAVWSDLAEDLRTKKDGVTPESGLFAAFECKCYDSEPPLPVARQFVGVLTDCLNVTTKEFVTNAVCGLPVRRFLGGTPRPSCNSTVEPFQAGEHAFMDHMATVMSDW